jgi:hypothetical protein
MSSRLKTTALQGLVEVLLSGFEIPLNLPLQRETFKVTPWKKGDMGIFEQPGLVNQFTNVKLMP